MDKETVKKFRGFGKKYSVITVLILLGYGLYHSAELTTILGGIAIFLIGMIMMDDGFKALAGGAMQTILSKLTSNIYKSMFGGFLLTSIVQSSSLVSVVAISFLSAGLIGLVGAIAVVFGANVGTTATAWLVAYFGLNIKISAYAMPMLVFGIILHFFKDNASKGTGNILLGLGLIFLGVDYMKSGFEDIQSVIDLSKFSMEGFVGLLAYTGIGILITLIIQSSSATMALVITALATGQVTYENSLALAIGANIGTTITAIIGSLTSNANGRRLALAHLLFNVITALFAIIFITPLANLVTILSDYFGFGEDLTLKLSLFHTIFNICGIMIMTPFIYKLVKFLNTVIVSDDNIVEVKYINHDLLASPAMSIDALEKEVEHLFKNGFKIISASLNVKPKDIKKCDDVKEILHKDRKIDIDIDKSYTTLIKPLEIEITNFAIQASINMDEEQLARIDDLRIATRDVVEAIKEIKHLKKNIDKFKASKNEHIKAEYDNLRETIAHTIKSIHTIAKNPKDESMIKAIATIKIDQQKFNTIKNKKMDILIREHKMDTADVISLMNDSSYVNGLIFKLCDLVEHLYINKDSNIKAMYDKYQQMYIPNEEALGSNDIKE